MNAAQAYEYLKSLPMDAKVVCKSVEQMQRDRKITGEKRKRFTIQADASIVAGLEEAWQNLQDVCPTRTEALDMLIQAINERVFEENKK